MDLGILLLSVAVLIGAVVVSTTGGDRKIARLDRRLARVERKLDAIVSSLGVELPEPELDEVKALLAEGKKIQAVRAYRQATGATLQEAAAAIERLGG
ncbi:hypothetical protein DMH04_37015 [Kibdelosporangium aridum]|uniref:Ribosomal protein L7/L12 C-terminal domain-containing protein n=1 Tax=Kibdelosporangium aridum TaxID=2030 RepID=A0A428YYS6_KIBAR|nr:hypothetical protein [Kibdelosporangium aridum]RSM75915.1 hypothetical protein DMH04_37015 [Kibdelosporangium aridum]